MWARTFVVAIAGAVATATTACAEVASGQSVPRTAGSVAPERPGSGAIAFSYAVRPLRPAEPRVSTTPVATNPQSRPVAAPASRSEETCHAPRDLDVLFIGNSYTIMHDLPGLFEALGTQAGIDVHAEMLAMGGQGFAFHLGRKQTALVLQARDWDVVVLQSHSLDPLRDPEGFLASGRALVQMVREAGASPVLFETWPRKSGHNLYNYFEPAGGDPDAMYAVVRERYEELAAETGAEVVHVGRAWREIRRRAPELDPYASDAAHPGKLGAYLTANMFFAALTDVSPVGNVEPLLGIEPEVARFIQRQAARVVGPSCPRP